MSKSSEIDMLHGPLTSNLIRFALPIALSSMLQQLFNSMDTAVVGRFADANALGAVGTNSEIVGFLVSLSSGLAVGANVLIAKFIGSGQKEKIKSAINSALVISICFGIFVGILGQALAMPIMRAINVSPEIIEMAALYLKLYFITYPFLLVYDFCSAILRSKGDSRRPFIALVISGGLNAVLNLFFVIVCKMGVAGVGTATIISTAVSCLLTLNFLIHEKDEFKLTLKTFRADKTNISNLLKIGIPAAIQGAVFCLANIFVQSAVNKFGALATAGNSIAVTFEYFAYYFATAFGQATTTFISQNFAANQRARCKEIFHKCLLCAVVSTPLSIFRTQAASIFTTDQTAIHYAGIRILMILLLQPFCAFVEIPGCAMRGLGFSLLPSLLTLIGICCVRIFWTCVVFPHINTYPGLLVIHSGSWFITIAAMWISWAFVKKRVNL